jgi:tagatose-6-phosphate ketose/aldose isomerase
MSISGYNLEELKSNGAINTGTEIAGQPILWRNTFSLFEKNINEIQNFLTKTLASVDKIILTGAGTSAFIGLSLKGLYQNRFCKNTEPIPTTDFVSNPNEYLSKNDNILLISFARSGNSPESVAAVKLADQICNKVIHFIITCDAKGNLANYKSSSERFVFVLPPESNDKSLAMTGSYSGMLLSGILIAHIQNLKGIKSQVERMCSYGEKILIEYAKPIEAIAAREFRRAVFLGSGPFFGTATESHLKLQELTDGKIICKNESFLGFRHGPKAVVDESTLMVYIFSNSEYSNQYETDLVRAMENGRKPALQISISESKIKDLNFDLEIVLSNESEKLNEEFLTVCQVIPGQLLGFFKSLHLGHKPDNPSVSNSITRVVQGVTIYEYSSNQNFVNEHK